DGIRDFHVTGVQCALPILRGLVRDSDTVARLGGDEFAVILPTVDDVHNATKVVTKLLQGLQRPLLLEGQRLEVAASIGVTLCPGERKSVGEGRSGRVGRRR